MNKQRKVVITTTYNEMGIIIDTKVEEVAQPNLQPTCNQFATDTISRQAAIEAVQNRHIMLNKEKVLLINDLEKLPPAEPNWIPVTEEPKESGKYLVTAVISFIPDHVGDPDTYEAVTTANYSADTRDPIKWWGNNVEKVLAWMPLPESFKGVTE